MHRPPATTPALPPPPPPPPAPHCSPCPATLHPTPAPAPPRLTLPAPICCCDAVPPPRVRACAQGVSAAGGLSAWLWPYSLLPLVWAFTVLALLKDFIKRWAV